jgi:hypothetical protein
MALALATVLTITILVLIARGSYGGAVVLAVLALPALFFAARRSRRRDG